MGVGGGDSADNATSIVADGFNGNTTPTVADGSPSTPDETSEATTTNNSTSASNALYAPLEGTWTSPTSSITSGALYTKSKICEEFQVREITTYSGNSYLLEHNLYSDSNCTQLLRTVYRETGSFTVSDGGELEGKPLVRMSVDLEVTVKDGSPLNTFYPLGTKLKYIYLLYLEGDRYYWTDKLSRYVNGDLDFTAPLTKIYLSNETDCLPENIKFNMVICAHMSIREP